MLEKLKYFFKITDTSERGIITKIRTLNFPEWNKQTKNTTENQDL